MNSMITLLSTHDLTKCLYVYVFSKFFPSLECLKYNSKHYAKLPVMLESCKVCVLWFSERNANVNAINGDGATPIHDAISRGDMEITEELLLAGASVNVRPHDGSVSLSLHS